MPSTSIRPVIAAPPGIVKDIRVSSDARKRRRKSLRTRSAVNGHSVAGELSSFAGFLTDVNRIVVANVSGNRGSRGIQRSPVLVIPCTKRRWNTTKTTRTGTMASTLTAMIASIGELNVPCIDCRPSGSV